MSLAVAVPPLDLIIIIIITATAGKLNLFLEGVCLRLVSPAGNRQPIPRDPVPAVSYK